MSPPEPFFYPQQLSRFAASQNRRQLLWGGRGIGKSAWLLQARESNPNSVLLRPSHFFQGEVDLPAETRLVLIDGLDLVARHPEARERLLTLISERLIHAEVRVIAGSRMDRGALSRMLAGLEDYDLFSDWVSHFSAERLNPWFWNWEGRVREALKGVGWITDPIAEELIRLSGGHPSLMGAGVDALRLRVPGDSGEGPVDERAVPGGPAALTEPMMESARHLAEKLIKELQSAPSGNTMLDKTRSAALDLLIDISNGTGQPDKASILARNFLLTSGMVIESSTGELTIPGPLLQEVFATGLAPPSIEAAVGAEQIRLRAQVDGGELIWSRADGRTQRCDLEGKSWAIVEHLARARASEIGGATRWLSPAEVAEAVGDTSDAYVRVVVRRVRNQLEAERHALIATDRSLGGYRFMVPVVFGEA